MTEHKVRELLFQIELLKRKKVQDFLTQIGLTPGMGQARILLYLESHSSVTQREIADACMLDVTTMSRALDKLERAGLLLRGRDPKCRRSYQISLTPAGKEKAAEVQEGFSALENILCSGFQEQEIAELTERLLRVRDNLSGNGENCNIRKTCSDRKMNE